MIWLLLIWLTQSPLPALAAEVLRAHAISMFDSETPRYPADFRYFDYVNPDAPKGGSLRLASQGSFDSFHPFIPRVTRSVPARWKLTGHKCGRTFHRLRLDC